MTYSIIPLIISIVALFIAIYNIHKKREVDRAIAMIYKRQFEQMRERERRLMHEAVDQEQNEKYDYSKSVWENIKEGNGISKEIPKRGKWESGVRLE